MNFNVPDTLTRVFDFDGVNSYFISELSFQELLKCKKLDNGVYKTTDDKYLQSINNDKHSLSLKVDYLDNIQDKQVFNNQFFIDKFENYVISSDRYDYIILPGGRSSAKTFTVIRKLVLLALREKNKKIVCCRQTQASLDKSTYSDLRDFIYEYDLIKYFKIRRSDILCTLTNVEIVFSGLEKGGVYSLKSVSNMVLCFVEEAEDVTEESWNVLLPTLVRNVNSQLIVVFNPKVYDSATYQRFVINYKKLYGKVLYIEQNYFDNPFLTDKALGEINNLKENNYQLYEYIYLGKILDISEDVIFKGRYEIREVDIETYPHHFWYQQRKIEPLYGIDFGFSVDPFAMVEVFILDPHTIYISREIYEYKLLPSNYKKKIKELMPEAMTRKILCDSARPDTIAELVQDGLRCDGAKKNKGSVEAGIEWLLGKKILINPKCYNTIYEFQNYKYKIDKNSGAITTDIIDANNHIIDGIRYSCCHLIEGGGKGILSLFANTNINNMGMPHF